MNSSGRTQLRWCGGSPPVQAAVIGCRVLWMNLSSYLLDVLILPCRCLMLILWGISTVSFFLLCPSTGKEISDAFQALQCLKSTSNLFDFPKQDQAQCCLVQTSAWNWLSHLQGRCWFPCGVQCFGRVPRPVAEGSAEAGWGAAGS